MRPTFFPTLSMQNFNKTEQNPTLNIFWQKSFVVFLNSLKKSKTWNLYGIDLIYEILLKT